VWAAGIPRQAARPHPSAPRCAPRRPTSRHPTAVLLVSLLQAGLDLLRADPAILRCYSDAWDARYHSDAGASLAVLQGGGGIDCLLTRYQGVDWWDHQNWQCNNRCGGRDWSWR
jgi:hypothetical protein